VSSLLDVAFASWSRRVSERGFDATFLSLLRAAGFYDIHFTHGAFEFGKDVIAKFPRTPSDPDGPSQYAFQLKAGDIGSAEWTAIVGQLHELTSAYLTHPNFDKSLPRRFVLATTGELKGKAPLAARAFQEEVRDRGLGTFVTWEMPNLIELLSGRGLMPLSPSTGLESAIGRIAGTDTRDDELESLLSPLVPRTRVSGAEAHRALLDNALCANALLERGRVFQAMTAVLNIVRIAAVQAYTNDQAGKLVLRDAMDLLVATGNVALADLFLSPSDSRKWMDWIGGYSRIVTYPVCCLRSVEFLGLRALHQRHCGDNGGFKCTVELLQQVFDGQPGVLHPISDRYAASLAPPILALAIAGDVARTERWLVATANWVCDRYEKSEAGLAPAHATADEEVRMLLGHALEVVQVTARRESLLAVAIADLAHSACPGRYADVVNEFLAVRIVPTALHGGDSVPGCFVGGGDTRWLLNIKYPDAVAPGGLPHALLQRDHRVPERLGGVAAQLGIACLCRDRLFTDCYARALAAASAN
jgi:hypothetical protein